MNSRRVEVYFVIYLTAVMGYFVIFSEMNKYKKERNKKEAALTTVIHELVNVGPIFKWVDPEVNKSTLSLKCFLVDRYNIKSKFVLSAKLYIKNNPDSLIFSSTKSTDISNDTISFDTFKHLRNDVKYKLKLYIDTIGNILITQKGKKYIANKLRGKIDTTLLDIETLVDTICSKLERKSTPELIREYPGVITSSGVIKTCPDIPNPVILGNSLIPALVTSEASFYYADLSESILKNIIFTVGEAYKGKYFSSINNNDNTFRLKIPPLKEGVYTLQIPPKYGIKCNARIYVKKVVISAPAILCVKTRFKATVNLDCSYAEDIKWAISNNMGKTWSDNGRSMTIEDGFNNPGSYMINIIMPSGMIIARKSFIVIKGETPRIKKLPPRGCTYRFSITSNCPFDKPDIKQYGLKLIEYKEINAYKYEWIGEINKELSPEIIYFSLKNYNIKPIKFKPGKCEE